MKHGLSNSSPLRNETRAEQLAKWKHGQSNSSPWLNETWANQSNWGTWCKKVELIWRLETWGAWWGACTRGFSPRSPEQENTGQESVSFIQVEQRRPSAYPKAKTEITWAVEKEIESRRAPRDLRGLMRGLLERRILSKSDLRPEINQRLDGWK